LIETVSYAARVLSLAIRLFANMMAGHTLLKILAGFAWQMLGSGGIWLVIGLAPIAIISAVSVLELAVAFLQTYVFTVLICLYIKDAAELH
jgi:ATP synthase subunit 6